MTEVSNISANKRIILNSIYMSVRMVIILFIQLYTTRVILSALGIEDYGIFNVVCGFVAMFSFLSTSMTNAIQRFYNYELGINGEVGIHSTFNVAIRVQCILAFFLTVLIELIGIWYIQNVMVMPAERLYAAHWVFHFSIISFVVIILQVPYSSIVIAKEKMSFYALMSVLNSVLGLCVAVLIKYSSCDKLILYGILLALIQIIIFVSYFIYSRKLSNGLVIKRAYDRELLKSMLGFSGWNVFGSFGGVVKEQGVNMILNFFCGPVVNAARGIANQVNGGFQGLVSNLGVSVRPQVTKSYAQGNLERTLSLTYSISKFSCIILFLFSFPILLDIDFVLHIWLGDNVPEYTQAFVIIVISTSFISNLNAAVSGVVHSSGRMKKYQIAGAVVNLISLPIAYIYLYSGYSPVVVLWVLFIITIIGQIVSLKVLKEIINYSIRDYLYRVIFPILAVASISMISPIILHTIMDPGYLRFITVTLYSIIITLIVTYFIGCTVGEKQIVKTFFYKVLNK